MVLDVSGNMEISGDLAFNANVTEEGIKDIACLKDLLQYVKNLENRIVELEDANERLNIIAYEGI